MKTRTNFVSNSSSTSFVIVMAKEDYDKSIMSIQDVDIREYFCSAKSEANCRSHQSIIKGVNIIIISGEFGDRIRFNDQIWKPNCGLEYMKANACICEFLKSVKEFEHVIYQKEN